MTDYQDAARKVAAQPAFKLAAQRDALHNDYKRIYSAGGVEMNEMPEALRLAGVLLDLSEDVSTELRRLHTDNQRLNTALQREQDRSERIGTHGPGCHLWGHRHHECLEREYQGAIAALKALVGWQDAEVAHFDAAVPDDWIMEKARAAIARAEGGPK